MGENRNETYCGTGIRGVAMTIDTFVWIAFLAIGPTLVGAVTGDLEITGTSMNTDLEGIAAVLGIALWLGLAIGYHTLFEWRFGKTIGKYLVGIRVTNADGSPLTLRSAAVRNVLRLVDWLPFFYVVGIGFLVRSARHERLGDRFGNTVVVRS